MKKLQIKAFTLVELIVVITILAILWTIAFISLQWYSANARDSVRIANLTNMDKWLAILQAKDWTLPLPEWSVTTITSSWSHILTQWEFTQSMAEKILKMSWDITDPVDWTNPIYTTSSDKKYYQVALFLEAENLAIANINSRDRKYSVPTEILQNTHAADWKTFISKWSKLWVIMTDTETPVNQTTDSTPVTTLELNTTTTHIAYLDESTKLETSWTDLSTAVAVAVSKAGSLVWSCKDILDRWMWTTDWEYTIYPTNQSNDTLQVYCDMTTDWGGWTLYTAKAAYWYADKWNMLSSLDKVSLDHSEIRWNYTSPSGTVFPLIYKPYSKIESKALIYHEQNKHYWSYSEWTTSDHHYANVQDFSDALYIWEENTSSITLASLHSAVIADNRNYILGRKGVWIPDGHYVVNGTAWYYNVNVRWVFWFPASPYVWTYRIWSDTFSHIDNTISWNDWRSISIWIK